MFLRGLPRNVCYYPSKAFCRMLVLDDGLANKNLRCNKIYKWYQEGTQFHLPNMAFGHKPR